MQKWIYKTMNTQKTVSIFGEIGCFNDRIGGKKEH